jgi:hypothetical protein
MFRIRDSRITKFTFLSGRASKDDILISLGAIASFFTTTVRFRHDLYLETIVIVIEE